VINYQRALEALRNGVPNRDAVRVLGSNQAEVEKMFTEKLGAAQSAAQQGKQATGELIAGGFGTGKSHLLEYLEHVAVSNNFVCSRIVISKETPLFDPAKMFQAAVDGAGSGHERSTHPGARTSVKAEHSEIRGALRVGK
jgi:hypothetical protein